MENGIEMGVLGIFYLRSKETLWHLERIAEKKSGGGSYKKNSQPFDFSDLNIPTVPARQSSVFFFNFKKRDLLIHLK